MKASFLAFTIMLLSTQVFTQGSLSADQKKFVSDYLNQTKTDFLKSIEGLTDAQLTYKADTSRWSIAQCAEHIALAETGLWMQMEGLLKQPADKEKAAAIKFTEQQIIGMLTDRSFKAQAPEPAKPTGKFPSLQAAAASFISQRDKLIQYGTTTNDDLLNHVWDSPVGVINLYQYIIFISAHTKRHTLQIEEVKTGEGYPK